MQGLDFGDGEVTVASNMYVADAYRYLGSSAAVEVRQRMDMDMGVVLLSQSRASLAEGRRRRTVVASSAPRLLTALRFTTPTLARTVSAPVLFLCRCFNSPFVHMSTMLDMTSSFQFLWSHVTSFSQ